MAKVAMRLGVVVLFACIFARGVFADCCTCTTPFDGGTFCGPTTSVSCSLSNGDVQCPGTTIAGGTCVGGTAPDGSGVGGTCVSPQHAPVLSPGSPAFVLTALGLLAAAVVLSRRARRQ